MIITTTTIAAIVKVDDEDPEEVVATDELEVETIELELVIGGGLEIVELGLELEVAIELVADELLEEIEVVEGVLDVVLELVEDAGVRAASSSGLKWR